MSPSMGMDWSRVVAAFAEAGARAHVVLATDAVRHAWEQDSVLPLMTVGDVGGHLLAVLVMFDRRYDAPTPPGVRPSDPVGGYTSIRLVHASDLERPPFRMPRDGGRRVAARGHAAVVEEFGATLARLEARLRDDGPDRPILAGDETAPTSLRAFTTSRIVELVVHADDLAESVGTSIPPPPADAAAIVIDHFVASVRHRVGDAGTIRALAGRTDPDQLRAL
jgi:Mycothiol maleylpyruvate isomerase N-terminal domain